MIFSIRSIHFVLTTKRLYWKKYISGIPQFLVDINFMLNVLIDLRFTLLIPNNKLMILNIIFLFNKGKHAFLNYG